MQSADPNLRLLNSFLDYLKVEKGLAPLSVSAYHSDLDQYSEFLLKRKRAPLAARRQHIARSFDRFDLPRFAIRPGSARGKL